MTKTNYILYRIVIEWLCQNAWKNSKFSSYDWKSMIILNICWNLKNQVQDQRVVHEIHDNALW